MTVRNNPKLPLTLREADNWVQVEDAEGHLVFAGSTEYIREAYHVIAVWEKNIQFGPCANCGHQFYLHLPYMSLIPRVSLRTDETSCCSQEGCYCSGWKPTRSLMYEKPKAVWYSDARADEHTYGELKNQYREPCRVFFNDVEVTNCYRVERYEDGRSAIYCYVKSAVTGLLVQDPITHGTIIEGPIFGEVRIESLSDPVETSSTSA